ncbi:glutactin-like [Wyeomyia smithii]|uniref:glutactin-like n=1 Tax=Wyeomyia smithii TaxID=174621 RepID=UPI0024680B7D|nr:glutactin-like [Wyeomyia smithii]
MLPSVAQIVFLVIVLCHLAQSQKEPNTLVDIHDLGVVRGSTSYTARTNQCFASFYNIPYAEPTTGAKRFKPPTRIAPWTAVRDVTQPGLECPQPDGHNQNVEDCLSLSVFTKNTNGSFPVMVYVHGGGFYRGSAAEYPPHYLLEREIVLVVLQYRLGPFGFLSTLSETIPGNAGILDIIMAVEWVRNYIADFGGDPQMITLFGQSAGAAAISALLYSPLVSHYLFQQVILQSGGSMSNWAIDSNPVANAKNIANLVGCIVDDTTLTAIEQCLMEASTQSLVNATLPHLHNIFIDGMQDISGMGMVVGGPSGFLLRTPLRSARQGLMRHDVRMMGGVTKQDGSFLLNSFYDHLVTDGRFNHSMYIQFELVDTMNRIMQLDDNSGALLAFEIQTLFSESDLSSGNITQMVRGLIDIAGAIALKGPVLRDIQANVRISEKETYLYTFDYAGEHTRFGYGKDTSHYPFSGGVHHSDENIYLFPYPDKVANLNQADTEISEMMLDLWTSFAIDGVPASNHTPPWQPVHGFTGPYMHIDKPASIEQNFYREFSATVRESSNALRYLGQFVLIVCACLTVIFWRF